MGAKCNTHEVNEILYTISEGKPEGKTSPGKPKHRCEGIIKIYDLKCKMFDWICMNQEGVQ
jgi:hypothetical protein